MKFLTNFANRFSPYDVYERHAVVSQLLHKKLPSKEKQQILDVGGRIALLDRFLPYKTISINPDGTGHILGDGGKLPFAANSFNAVVNIDTLEHLPRPVRLPFIQECTRVSQQNVIVAAPFGSEAHIQLEKELNELHIRLLGQPHHYLGEHVEYGLPTAEQLEIFAEALRPFTSEFYYAGDFIWQGRSFARAVRAHQQPRLLAHFTNLYNRISGTALFHPISLTTKPTPTTNRFYLVITKSR